MDAMAGAPPPALVDEFQIGDDFVRVEGDLVLVASLVVVQSNGVRLGTTGARGTRHGVSVEILRLLLRLRYRASVLANAEPKRLCCTSMIYDK